jgi:hypothetical protein
MLQETSHELCIVQAASALPKGLKRMKYALAQLEIGEIVKICRANRSAEQGLPDHSKSVLPLMWTAANLAVSKKDIGHTAGLMRCGIIGLKFESQLGAFSSSAR